MQAFGEQEKQSMGEIMKSSIASVQEALKDTEYPAEKRDLVLHAKKKPCKRRCIRRSQKPSR